MKYASRFVAFWALKVLCLTWAVYAHADDTAARLPLVNIDSHFDFQTLKGNGGSWQASPDDAAAVRITTPAGRSWPGVVLPAPQGKWDLSAYEYVSLDIHNVDKKDIDVFVRVDNPGATGLTNCITERAFVAPDQRTTLTIPLKRVSDSPIKLFGMVGYPQALYPDKEGLDPANIVAIVAFTGKAAPTDSRFDISNIYAAGRFQAPVWLKMTPEQFFPFVDKFGQFMHKDWPGKIHDEAELAAAKEVEAKQLATDAGPADWDKFGGWAEGPALEATGHFRTAKQAGKWWLVDPDGHLFFSTGLTGVRPGWADTPIEDRANWFAELPPNEGIFKEHYHKTYMSWSGHYAGKEPLVFDFSTLNLQHKYGLAWRENYPTVVHQRLRAWGINTLGNWSDGKWSHMQRTPYTGTFFYNAKKLRPTGSGFPDVFDPGFAKNVNSSAKSWLAGADSDPYCIGFFCDNEMPWGGDTQLALDALRAPADQAAKLELIHWLKQKYPTIDDLNKAWDTPFSDYDALPVGAALKNLPKTAAAIQDLTAFTDRVTETYFRTMRDALKAVAPHKLYLGCRSVGGSANAIAIAIKYCDVVSYNRYCFSVRDQKFPAGLDAPMLIGEFHFGASDRGLFWNGLVSTTDQSDRARKYADYVNSALDNPQIVGIHWFQYGDEAVTGRGDGENAQCGFVDVCDTPYAETIHAARAVGDAMYARRGRVQAIRAR